MEKKKSSNYIIPATFFSSLSPVKKKIVKSIVKITSEKSEITLDNNLKTINTLKKPLLKNIKRRTSALSLKSIHQKKEVKISLNEDDNFHNHPKTPFTQQQLKETWVKYSLKIQEIGEHSIAAVLVSNEPVLGKDYSITFSIPNDLMQIQLERTKGKLTNFLREKLNNYGIKIIIVVNEVEEKKFAYTPQEKYSKLKEKNPLIEQLKNIFNLDF